VAGTIELRSARAATDGKFRQRRRSHRSAKAIDMGGMAPCPLPDVPTGIDAD
jgi:hypothetical protein